jgi:hypothetical protein
MDTVAGFQQTTVNQQSFAYQTHSGRDVTVCCQVTPRQRGIGSGRFETKYSLMFKGQYVHEKLILVD